MGWLARSLGVGRSLIVYHAIPFRQSRLRKLYRQFVRPGDLAFDIGAHAGNRVRGLYRLGCRVVAVEPQPDMTRVLRTLFGRSPRISIVEAVVAAAGGRQQLMISERHPTLTTSDRAWRDARAGEPGFERVRWATVRDVDAVTLDTLIARYGVPAFVKIDVEGSELAVLSGLSRPVAAISFEYLPRAVDLVEECAKRLESLGDYEFNWSPGETFELASASWLSAAALASALREPGAQRTSGDVYARLIDDARQAAD